MPDCREENQRGRLTLSFYEEEKIGSFLLLFHKKGIYRLTDFRFEKETTEEKKNEIWQSLCGELYRRQIKLLLKAGAHKAGLQSIQNKKNFWQMLRKSRASDKLFGGQGAR